MAVILKVIRGRDFIQSASEEVLDLESSKKMLVTIASEAVSPPHFNILLDLRYNQWRLSSHDIYILAQELAGTKEFVGDKIAVLTLPGANFDHAEFFELCAQNRGANVQAFTNFEDAIQWFYH